MMSHDPAATAASNAARHAGLELRAHAVGAVITVTLANVGDAPIQVLGPVAGPSRRHFDGITAVLRDASGAERKLIFSGPRNASEIGVVLLEPANLVGTDLDLTAWAMDEVNGASPLASGQYRVALSYEISSGGPWWSGRLTIQDMPVEIP